MASAAACTQATPMLSLPWAPDPLAPELAVGRRVETKMVTQRRVSIVQTAAPHDQIQRWLQQSEEVRVRETSKKKSTHTLVLVLSALLRAKDPIDTTRAK